MAGYVLVFTTAKDCTACRFLEATGFFEELLKLEGDVVEEIMHVEAEHLGAPIKNYNRVFSLQYNYPNYKLMKIDTYNKLINDINLNDNKLIEQIHFMNAVYNPSSGIIEKTSDYKLDVESIRSFCVDSINKDRRGPVKVVKRIAKPGPASGIPYR
jgi:hypothetical protein